MKKILEEERECKCIKCVGNCNHFGCKFHTPISPSKVKEECKHNWIGTAWQPDTQACSKCGISWRDANPSPKSVPELLVYDWDEVGSHMLKETVKKLNEVITYLESWRKG